MYRFFRVLRGDEVKHTESIKKNYEFKRLYKSGKSFVNSVLAIYVRKNRLDHNRVGITVTVKLGSAPVRNKVRRRIKEAYRINEQTFMTGFDIVIVARQKAVTSDFHKIESALLSLFSQMGVLL